MLFAHGFPPELVMKTQASILTKKDYENLKVAVIKSYDTPHTHLELSEKLINDTKMTGRLSHYLSKLMATADKVVGGEDLVKYHFTQAMPSTVKECDIK